MLNFQLVVQLVDLPHSKKKIKNLVRTVLVLDFVYLNLN